MSKPRFTISAVILAHQYSPLFEEVVQSVSWCDEIVIVLSEPVKEIEELCHRVSAKCFFRPFDGYGPQKQFAISKASHDWILNIDSDEWVSPKCKKEILELLESDRPSLFSAFTIRQKFMFLGKALNFSGTRKSPIRFFDRKRSQMNSSVVHESIEASGKIGHIQGPILHYSYSSLEDYLNKFNRYTSLAAAELHKKGKKTNFLLIWGRFPFLFIRRYFLQLGFLDGCYGFTWCFLSALYSSIKYLKLQELALEKNHG